VAERKETIRQRIGIADRDTNDIQSRLQHQINDLVERVTGIRQIKRQYLALGLSIGVLMGIVLGIIIGIAVGGLQDDKHNA
jgi:tetrahydromethanopterin S-methyltransferase subunit G